MNRIFHCMLWAGITLTVVFSAAQDAYAQNASSPMDRTETFTPKQAKKWMAARSWAGSLNLLPDKSVDAVEFAEQYHRNRELWDKAFAFLRENDLNALSEGTQVLEKGRCWVTVSRYVPKAAAEVRIEGHRRFVDLQYVPEGNEKMGIVPAGRAVEQVPYNEKRDIAFYRSRRVKYRKTAPNTFFLFFPFDLHQPSVAGKGPKTQSRKIVIKIEYLP